MKDIAKFIAGFRRFQEKYFSEDRERFNQLRQGQRPKAAIIACADSRVDPALQARACQQAAILVSLENLMTYPWIAGRVVAGTMHLHGWCFDIAQGELWSHNPACNGFEPIWSDAVAR